MGGIRAGDAAIGLMVAALGLIGLIQAAGATDNEIYVFGLSLLGFAVVFNFVLLKRHYDTTGSWPEDGYNEAVVKKFLIASMFWGVVGVPGGRRARCGIVVAGVEPRHLVHQFRTPAAGAHFGRHLRVRRMRAVLDIVLRCPTDLPGAVVRW